MLSPERDITITLYWQISKLVLVQCTTGNPVPVPVNPDTFLNPVPAKHWPDLILIFKMIKMQQFSFSGAGKPFYAKFQINFTSELFLKSINTNIFM